MLNVIEYDTDLLEDIFTMNLLSSKSPAIYHYNHKTDLWSLIQRSLKDDLLIQLMVFNMKFDIAPLHTYIQYYAHELHEFLITKYEKQCLGSIVSILFISLGFEKQKRNYRKDAMIKYASFFTKNDIAEDNCIDTNGNNHGDR